MEVRRDSEVISRTRQCSKVRDRKRKQSPRSM